MKKMLAALTVGLAVTSAQSAGMVGDTLTFQRAYPTPATPYWDNDDESTTVAVGTSDLINWYSNFTFGFQVLIDPEANHIDWRMPMGSLFLTDSTQFDGFVITGFSRDIASVSVLDNTSNLTLSIANSAREIQLGLTGWNSGGSTGFVLDVQFAPIPEPATWALAAAGLFAVGATARRQRKG